MKKLASLALLCSTFVLTTSGCIITTDPGDSNPPPDGTPVDPIADLDIAWFLTTGPDKDVLDGCAEGVTTEVATDLIGTTTAPDFVTLFNCKDGSGLVRDLPTGDYDVWINIYDGDDPNSSRLIARSPIIETPLLVDGAVELLDVEFPHGGFFELDWTITDDIIDFNCEDPEVDADGVSVLATMVGTDIADDIAIDSIFSCDNYAATTNRLPATEYTVSVSLLRGQENLNELNPVEQHEIEYGDEVVDLGIFEFVLPPGY